MNIKYVCWYDQNECERKDCITIILDKISITEAEKTLLKNYNMEIMELIDDKVQIKIKRDDYHFYYIEIDNENKGIYFEKTHFFQQTMKDFDIFFSKEEINNYQNLIISKEGIRIELVISKRSEHVRHSSNVH